MVAICCKYAQIITFYGSYTWELNKAFYIEMLIQKYYFRVEHVGKKNLRMSNSRVIEYGKW